MMLRRFVPVSCLLMGLWVGNAQAEDSIRIARPEDQQLFDAAVSQKLGKPISTGTTPAPLASEIPAPTPSASPAGAAGELSAVQVASPQASAAPTERTARQAVIAQAIHALKKNDVRRFQGLLTAEARNKIGTPEAITRFEEVLNNNKDLQLAEETLQHSIQGKQSDGSTKPILELYSEAVRHKDASTSSESVMMIQVLCGTKAQGASCLIQDIAINGP